MHFPNESADYRAAREQLLEKERDLRRAAEAVARERRALPLGGEVPEDYVFENKRGKQKLSDLFGKHDTLAIYSFMFGPEVERPCNMCTPMMDALDAVTPNILERLSLIIAAESEYERLDAFFHERGWRYLPLVSCAGNNYNRDYHGKSSQNGQDTTMLNVFRKKGGKVRHFWGTEMAHDDGDPGQDHRGLDMLNPTFQMLDLTPDGRGDFYTRLSYR